MRHLTGKVRPSLVYLLCLCRSHSAIQPHANDDVDTAIHFAGKLNQHPSELCPIDQQIIWPLKPHRHLRLNRRQRFRHRHSNGKAQPPERSKAALDRITNRQVMIGRKWRLPLTSPTSAPGQLALRQVDRWSARHRSTSKRIAIGGFCHQRIMEVCRSRQVAKQILESLRIKEFQRLRQPIPLPFHRLQSQPKVIESLRTLPYCRTRHPQYFAKLGTGTKLAISQQADQLLIRLLQRTQASQTTPLVFDHWATPSA